MSIEWSFTLGCSRLGVVPSDRLHDEVVHTVLTGLGGSQPIASVDALRDGSSHIAARHRDDQFPKARHLDLDPVENSHSASP